VNEATHNQASPAGFDCGAVRHVIGTPLLVTNYDRFHADSLRLTRGSRAVAVDFANTQVVTMRRSSRKFCALTSPVDLYLPDGMPLIWCMNRQQASLTDRIYGPEFMRRCLTASSPGVRHYLMGGTEECGAKLRATIRGWNPACEVVGSFHGRCDAEGRIDPALEQATLDEINHLRPDYVWVGLGTPKQQLWMSRCRDRLRGGLLLGVGFAFDVHAGLKPDAPMWMQRRGLAWLFRLSSEPRRLGPRYLRYNGLFLWYLLCDGLRGRAFLPPAP
jgi:N-acetylglucosaminyldiphosphoundecaprenol N-acetyl-beta-D-mannosaminyltransferase